VPLFLIILGALLMVKVQGMKWEFPECKSLLLYILNAKAFCQYLDKGSSCAYPHETQEPGSIIWEDHHQLGQVAKAEAICLMEKNPGLKTSSERLGCALCAILHQNKFECWSGSFY